MGLEDDDELIRLLDSAMSGIGSRREEGESYREPPLDVLAYYVRSVQLSRIPVLGRASSIVVVLRPSEPMPQGVSGFRGLIEGVARVVEQRFPPLRRGAGLTMGLTIVCLTDGAIDPEAESALQSAIDRKVRSRVVTLGLILLNSAQAVMNFALRDGPGDLFPDAKATVAALEPHCRRFLPLFRDEEP